MSAVFDFNPRIYLATPYHGPVDMIWVKGLVKLLTSVPNLDWIDEGFKPIDMSRNLLVWKYLKISKRCDDILFLDSDGTITPTDLNKLIEANKDIISATVVKAVPPQDVVAYNYNDKIDAYELAEPPMENEIKRYDAIGMHCVLIKRKVFEKICFPWFSNQFSLKNGLPKMIGEDFTFCERARAKGFEIHVHGGVLSGHIGANEFLPRLEKRTEDETHDRTRPVSDKRSREGL